MINNVISCAKAQESLLAIAICLSDNEQLKILKALLLYYVTLTLQMVHVLAYHIIPPMFFHLSGACKAFVNH